MRDEGGGVAPALRFGWLGVFCLFVATGLAYAATPTPIPEATGLLVDRVGALSEGERETLAARLRAIQDSGRAQVAILVSEGTGGEPLADYALRVAEKWELGRAQRDDGLLVLVVPSTGAARIEVGYGLEGPIPDARASRWLDDLIPAMKEKALAQGLDRLLDEIERALPEADAKKSADANELFSEHEEWRIPFVLFLFSPFALFPMFFARWASGVSALLLAAFFGGAAWALWDSQTAGMIAAGIAFPFPLLWGLNWAAGEKVAPWREQARAFGNLVAVAYMFTLVTVFVGTALYVMAPEVLWIAPTFAGLLATGLAATLFPGRPARVLMVVLRSAMHFLFMLTVAWIALYPFFTHPLGVAVAVAGAVTAAAALGLWLDSRGRAAQARWCFGVALVLTLPVGLLALFYAVVGEDAMMQVVGAATGGGSIIGALSSAAKHGLLAAAKIGLGGRFGGGGAGRG